MTNTQIVYEYCDGTGPNPQERLVVAGILALDQIVDTLEAREFFIPHQVGLNDLQLRSDPEAPLPTAHSWHRLVEMGPTEEAPIVALTAALLHARFHDAVWDEDVAVLQRQQPIREPEDVQNGTTGKIICLKRVRERVPWDWHCWPVRLVGEDPLVWYGYRAHQGREESPVPYSKLDWTRVPPPLATVIVLNFAGALTEEIWSELFAGWSRFSILPDLHHLMINSSLRYADGQVIHEQITLFLERIARAYHWDEQNWAAQADAVLALYPVQEPLRTLLQQSLAKLFGRTPVDARQDLARRINDHA